MSDIIRIWVETTHNSAFRSGGWAYVLAEGRALPGAAGARKAARAGARVEVRSASRALIALPARLTAAEQPAEDLDLWAQLTAALKARTVSFARTANAPKTPTAFAAAWAELARDKV